MEQLVLCGAGPGCSDSRGRGPPAVLFVRSGFYSLAMGKSSGSFGGVQEAIGVGEVCCGTQVTAAIGDPVSATLLGREGRHKACPYGSVLG